jgi:hypothetical protein
MSQIHEMLGIDMSGSAAPNEEVYETPYSREDVPLVARKLNKKLKSVLSANPDYTRQATEIAFSGWADLHEHTGIVVFGENYEATINTRPGVWKIYEKDANIEPPVTRSYYLRWRRPIDGYTNPLPQNLQQFEVEIFGGRVGFAVYRNSDKAETEFEGFAQKIEYINQNAAET